MAVNRDFIQLRSIEGELKLSQKKSDYGLTVSTKELVFHKPHVNYHIKYEDVVSIVPFESLGKRAQLSVEHPGRGAVEQVSGMPESNQYRLFAGSVTMHNRSGLTTIGAMQFVLPIPPQLMRVIAEYSGLSRIP